MVREPPKAPTAGNPVKCEEGWGRVRWGGGGDRGLVIEVEGGWNLGGMGMLSCMRAGIGMDFCVLVLVLVVELVWMILTVCVVVGVLAVVAATVMV